ncbi:efflux transporter outer membrane subunit [Dongia sedimenti]|uniref:Efflux transporter outer membrane subunit n=1 Tax=Dongia sedimenti TaxID=3064282 RepID=A0ABU0YLG7_9PROT|nr:efflux transporter outer membrane subunit [Rhodospirillaceae bacterium R-7]
MRRLPFPAAALGLLLGGCTLIPDYFRPDAPVAASWPSGPAYAAQPVSSTAAKAADIDWQSFYTDDKLRRLIALSIANNRDLRVAMLNVQKAQAQYRVQRSNLLPTINADTNGTIQRVGRATSQTGIATTEHSYTAQASVSSFELDLFGRLRSLDEQALETYFATEEAQRAAQITLVAEIATAYLTLESDQEKLELARDTATSQQQSLDLTRRIFAIGTASELDVRQAETSVDTARVDIAQFTTAVAQDVNALVLLVGQGVPDDLLPVGGLGTITEMSDVPSGLPSDLLEARPDIREAERTLKAANANIGAARAAFFPKITLTANAGSTSDALSTLFKAGTGGWAFAPDIIVPIFDAGANRANLDAAKVDRSIEVANYEKAVQTAFREVADALAERGTIDEQVAAQQSLVDSTAASYRLAQQRYAKGVSSYLDVLDAQRSLYTAQQDLITIRFGKLSNLVTLYKVLGGGWKQETQDAQL